MKTNIVHTLFRVQKYGLMSIDQINDILSPTEFKRSKRSPKKDLVFLTINCVYKFHISGEFYESWVSESEFVMANVFSNHFFVCFNSCRTQVLDFVGLIFYTHLCSTNWVLPRTMVDANLWSNQKGKSLMLTR